MSLFNVVGQKKIATMLSKSIENKKISHAYIFYGEKGIGKKKMALEFAKALNCLEKTGDSCDICISCKRIENDSDYNIKWIKPDGKTIKIDQIRETKKDSNYKNDNNKYKVTIIEQADLLTNQAANSLLKFLEEPNSANIIILITENYFQLLPTIRSRCQSIYFSSLSTEAILDILTEEKFDEDDIIIAANLTNDITEIREILLSDKFAQMRNIVIKWDEDIRTNKYRNMININNVIIKDEYIKENLDYFLDLLILWYRDILNYKLNLRNNLIFSKYRSHIEQYSFYETEDSLIRRIESVLTAKRRVSSYVNPQIALEEMVISLWEG